MRKFLKVIKSFRKRLAYYRCYDKHEGYGAIFEMCNKCDDKNCPFYTEVCQTSIDE